MRLSMKSLVLPYDLPMSSGTPYVPVPVPVPGHQQCSITKRTQELTFQSQQSINRQSLNQTKLTPVVRQSRAANRWKEYMGVRDWDGLLDPLDDHLRDEILRYGSFIEATYRGFEFNPHSSSYGSSKYKKKSFFEQCGLPTPGYRLTRHLRATSGIQVPGWASSSWSPMQTSWIGYVAVCTNKAMIKQLGRREVVIALRGTATCLEWLENLRATLAPVPGPISVENDNVGPWNVDSPPMVESGFLSLYTSGNDMWPSLQDAIRIEIGRILDLYQDKEPLSITITGHSLGAALATLAAYDIKTTFDRAPLVTVISFGGPRVGNQSFRSLVDKQGTKILRVVNPSDLITKLPGFVTDNNEDFVNIDTSPSATKKIGIKNSPRTSHNNNNKNNNRSNRPGTITSVSDSTRFGKILSSHFGKGKIKSSSKSRLGVTKSGSSKMKLMGNILMNWVQQFRVDDTRWWVYAEVGRELRLENRESAEQLLQYYLSNMDVAKCHDLKTYLNLVEDCPLKNFVRRSLNKLTQRCTRNAHEKDNNINNNSGVLAL
ncbi:hypothetical protein SOVF_172940 [Spinacia oleracea]|uniref:Phospholipase A(1) DAD1, chloroplastic n=1 Tax=Spinacia oleracea TaxID=3562 RepID=A0ABM3R7F4_SPIOL|nr:phospholipase A(1) DAD1, chloroplastic [Spinacia oleracea]KNA07333.1 hypothetical protein SOVF_172940 [Spinacia oleracea]